MESDVPFGLVAQLLDLGPADAPMAAGDARPAMFERARSWAEASAARGPVMLLLDDVHWADVDSIEVVAYLAAMSAELPLALVAVMRPWPPGAADTARSLASSGVAELISLEPLSRRSADELLGRLVGFPPPDALSRRAWTLSVGNPYIIEQAAGLITLSGDLPERVDAGGAGIQDALVLSRLAGVSEEALGVAQAAAILGPEFRMTLVGPVSGLAPHRAIAALDDLFSAGVLRESRAGWAAFAHAVVCDALDQNLLPGRRIALHRRAFELLADLGETAAAARHATAADLAGDARAIAVVAEAGRASLSAGAVLAAADLFRSAIALAGPAAPGWLRILLGQSLLAVGLPADAAASFRPALDDPGLDDATVVQAHRSLALALAYSGDLAGADRVGRAALDLARRRAPGAVPGVVIDQVHSLWQAQGPNAARALLAELGAELPLPDDPALAAARLFITYCGTGDPAALPALAAIASEPGEGPLSPFEPRLVYACVARWEEQFEVDERTLDAAEAAADRAGVLRARFALELGRVENRTLRGRLPEALALLGELERDVPIEPLIAPAVTVAQADVLCQMGRLEEAAARLDARPPEVSTWQLELARRTARARLLFEEGRLAEACAAYGEAEALVARLGVGAPLLCPWAGGAITAGLAAGRYQGVVRVCEWLEARPAGDGGWPKMTALAGRAALAAAGGRDEEAAWLYARAVALPCEVALDRARVLVRFGEWLRAGGEHARARPLFAEAVAVAEAAAAEPLLRRASAGLRAVGGRRSRRRLAPGELSEQERRVAALAAEGDTTAEIAAKLFISPKTVETHLGRVYTKLGVTSRRALRGRRFERADEEGPGGPAPLPPGAAGRAGEAGSSPRRPAAPS